ncbi:hypothetical protein IMSAGC013_01565 [Lachnospiraceae bacterium]|nr:hypothetical protein [Lachnospiraceae bacterium]GFI30177.1 hypothetical protein IMSAGC013_01565 [Lachnospiraceae bacterium]
MVAQEWTKFASTGSIQDYLTYKGHGSREAALSMMAEREEKGGSVRRDGADHNADRYDFICGPGGRI